MTEESLKQTSNLLKNSKNVAILLPAEINMDEYCTAAAIKLAVQKEGTSVSIFSVGQINLTAPFLKNAPEVRQKFSKSDQFAVKISTAHAKPGELRYEVESDGVVIYLKSSSGEFLSEDVSVMPVRQKFDLFISIGVSRLEQLGDLYNDNAAVFYDTPHINIDNKPHNEYFGTLNAVIVTASSLSEIGMEILAAAGPITDEVATALLAGIIDSTHSFRDPRTSPKTLAAAAKLIESGARQAEIIQYLFKTKPFTVLQLWGRALARLSTVPNQSLLYTTLTRSDMLKTEAKVAQLPEVLRDLAEIVSGFSVIAMVVELDVGHQVLLAGLPHANVETLATRLGAPAQTAQPLLGQFEYVSVNLQNKTTAELQEQLKTAVGNK